MARLGQRVAEEIGSDHCGYGCSPGRTYFRQQVSGGLTVASDRQIAANRRNALESTGPVSYAGINRARHNADRHGLSKPIYFTELYDKEVNRLAHKIAGDPTYPIDLGRARAIAAAELDLARVRQVKISLIERVHASGALNPRRSKAVDCLATMPSQEPDRSVEAVRRILPELLRLHRYERRATMRRYRAVREVVKI